MTFPDVAETRALLPYIGRQEREEIQRALFCECGEGSGLASFTKAELDRLELLILKMDKVFPHCSAAPRKLSLRELFDALPDDELREFLTLYRKAGL